MLLARGMRGVGRGMRVGMRGIGGVGGAARPVALTARRFANNSHEDECGSDMVHFKVGVRKHPLRPEPVLHGSSATHGVKAVESNSHQKMDPAKFEAGKYHAIVNHVWTQSEIDERLANLWQHKPTTLTDKALNGLMWSMYRGFNWVTGFKAQNTPVKAVEWRLIVLESVAGVPGFVAAMVRHFRCLRTLKRDHGWIHTLLEEAENERMHLLTCMQMFEAGTVTKLMVMAAQCTITPFMVALYVVKPQALHRFVGYLEETACLTYANIILQVETPGTPLHAAWAQKDAPDIAINYWHLSADCKWVDVLKCMFADECNHRDVNHTLAYLKTSDPNPFVLHHQQDAAVAWRLHADNKNTDVGCSQTLGRKTEDA